MGGIDESSNVMKCEQMTSPMNDSCVGSKGMRARGIFFDGALGDLAQGEIQ